MDIMILPLEGDEKTGWKAGTPTPFLVTTANENGPVFSPDGRWLAYPSTESGAPEIYVRPFAAARASGRSRATGGIFPDMVAGPPRAVLP